MHHVEENLPEDLSSTLPFRRDSFLEWLKYWGRFMTIGLLDLAQYFAKTDASVCFAGDRRRGALLERGRSARVPRAGAAAVVFLIPLVIIRTLMMMGNWGQHAFVDPSRARRCRTVQHHLHQQPLQSACIQRRLSHRPSSAGAGALDEYPVEFEANIPSTAATMRSSSRGSTSSLVWLLLMTGRWSILARAFVQLPGAPLRSNSEIIDLLKGRVQPVPRGRSSARDLDRTERREVEAAAPRGRPIGC